MQTDTDEIAEDAVPLCPGCFHVLEGDPDFCPGCNAPAGMITLIDPLREAKAYAYLYRRGAEFPNTWLLFLGMLTIAGANLAMAFVFAHLGTGELTATAEWIGIGLLVLFYGGFGGTVFYKTMRNADTPVPDSGDPADML